MDGVGSAGNFLQFKEVSLSRGEKPAAGVLRTYLALPSPWDTHRVQTDGGVGSIPRSPPYSSCSLSSFLPRVWSAGSRSQEAGPPSDKTTPISSPRQGPYLSL